MKKPPFPFVLEELADLEPYTKPMFGFTGVYVGEKIVLILKERESFPEDNGVWIATFGEHHDSLKKELPSMRSLVQFGPGPTSWQTIPVESQSFEEEVMHLCGLIRGNDPRVGKVPKRRNPAKKKKKR